MGAISSIYFAIFIPLIAALLCQVFHKKIVVFSITFLSCVALLLLFLKTYPVTLAKEFILNDFNLSNPSLALEFKLDKLSIIFLVLFICLKLITLVFYKSDIERNLNENNHKIFYSVFLFNVFGLVGIFTTNNIFNLFLFTEIFSFGFFASLFVLRNQKLLKISFKYFCISAASSLLILFSFFIIYLITKETNLDLISQKLSLISSGNSEILWLIFLFLSAGFVVKFFPFWLYFKKIKNTGFNADFLSINILFIKPLVGIFLVRKFTYLLFQNNFFANSGLLIILLILSVLLIVYSALELCRQKHLRTIAAYLSLNNLGCILSAIILQNPIADKAIIFYLLNFILLNSAIFIFATFLKKRYFTSAINKIYMIENNHFFLTLPLKIIVLLIAGIPFTFLFFANWSLMNAAFAMDVRIILLAALIFSAFMQLQLATKMVSYFYAKK